MACTLFSVSTVGLPACRLACLPASLPACLPACLPLASLPCRPGSWAGAWHSTTFCGGWPSASCCRCPRLGPNGWTQVGVLWALLCAAQLGRYWWLLAGTKLAGRGCQLPGGACHASAHASPSVPLIRRSSPLLQVLFLPTPTATMPWAQDSYSSCSSTLRDAPSRWLSLQQVGGFLFVVVVVGCVTWRWWCIVAR